MRVAAGSHKAAWLSDPLPYLAAALLFFGILFGGGGAEGPLQNGFIEAAGALLLAFIAARHFGGRPLSDRAAIPSLLSALLLAVIGFQLIPLPPQLWSGLPGRETAVAIDLLIDRQLAWRPLSLDPEATCRAAAALLVPIPIMLIASSASQSQLLLMVRAAIAAAICSAALGAAQLALGSPKGLAAYGEPVLGAATGVFANSNHHAALLLCALVLSGLLIRLSDPSLKVRTGTTRIRLNLSWLLLPIFTVMVVAAMSRAGWILLAPALAAALLIATDRRLGFVPVLLMGIVAAGGAILLISAPTGEMADLPALIHDNRLISMPDILYTLDRSWPAGSGLGTFVPVFMANENIDLVTSAYLNHAHNDVLELMIEMGAAGVFLLVVGLGCALRRLWNVRRGKPSAEVTASLAGATILALLFLHSLVDYPLRADAIAAVAGLALGLLVSGADTVPGTERSGRTRSKKGFGSSNFGAGSL